ncbi:MAG TPA: helix-turn-helix transcriptional regulator [Pyrinomonadaceae bacterium]|jgi:transcriptional regulator with XRE-family HTH domain
MERTITMHELRTRRVALGLSQAKLAERLGVDTMTVSRWERGVRSIPTYIALALEAIEMREVQRRVEAA